MIYLDRLSFSSVLKILSIGEKKICVLEDRSHSLIVEIIILIQGIEVSHINFFSGNLKDRAGESVSFVASKLANKIAIDLANEELESQEEIKPIYKVLKQEVVVLHYAKKLLPEIFRFTLQAEVILSLFKEPISFVMMDSCEVNFENIKKYYPEVNFNLYSNWIVRSKALVKLFGILIYKGFLGSIKFRDFFKYQKLPNNKKNSVLTICTNTLDIDKSLRGQPYWRGIEGQLSDKFIYILGDGFSYAKGLSITTFNKINVYPIEFSILNSILKKYNQSDYISNIRKVRYKLILNITHKNILILLRMIILLRNSELMGALVLHLKITVFVNEEPYYEFSDAIEAISENFNIKTIGYQYSNLGGISTMMLTNSDYFFTFSNLYNNIYTLGKFGPKNIIPNGYLFDFNNPVLIGRANELRENFKKSGVNFVICYFDERVDHDKWGTVSNESHYQEFICLIKYLLENKEVGLIVKPQFFRYRPSIWYKKDCLINKAISSGRYFELASGKIGKRNDVLPAEAAHASDICISHKFGGTAALEAALCGKRVALLNSVTYKCIVDMIYEKVNIERASMESVIASIIEMREAKIGAKNSDFGDWSSILKYFNHYQDSSASIRIENKINQLLK
ncbi:hypothetical protein [Polynucleobacter bastaniensis]|uniref:hypothetical protein n=1 Tax=Polynucleobacter bastaniensis TaxID=2081039 RepID=UPI001C0B631C|nr:hypothetical protein [Polynucleobacter bastaniensis]MBU3598264.1 hypothetical protein [Polynucleobacter bastaniensis]